MFLLFLLFSSLLFFNNSSPCPFYPWILENIWMQKRDTNRVSHILFVGLHITTTIIHHKVHLNCFYHLFFLLHNCTWFGDWKRKKGLSLERKNTQKTKTERTSSTTVLWNWMCSHGRALFAFYNNKCNEFRLFYSIFFVQPNRSVFECNQFTKQFNAYCSKFYIWLCGLFVREFSKQTITHMTWAQCPKCSEFGEMRRNDEKYRETNKQTNERRRRKKE